MKILAGLIESAHIASKGTSKYDEVEDLIYRARSILREGLGDVVGEEPEIYISSVTFDKNRLIVTVTYDRKKGPLKKSFGIAPVLEIQLKNNEVLQFSARVLDTGNSRDIMYMRIGEVDCSGMDPEHVYHTLSRPLSNPRNWKRGMSDARDALLTFYKNTLFRILRKYSSDPSKPVSIR